MVWLESCDLRGPATGLTICPVWSLQYEKRWFCKRNLAPSPKEGRLGEGGSAPLEALVLRIIS